MAPTTRGDYQNVRNNFILGGDQDNDKKTTMKVCGIWFFDFRLLSLSGAHFDSTIILVIFDYALGELGDLLLFVISLSVSIVNKTKPSTRRRWGDLKEVMVFVLLFILSFLSLLISSLSLLILC